MRIVDFLATLKTSPDAVEFQETINLIESHYDFFPTPFQNGSLHNPAEQNQGSCKLLAFAQLQQLTQPQTLACFGHHYREDVLQHPDANNHQNIRNFMTTGWAGVSFEGQPLVPRDINPA